MNTYIYILKNIDPVIKGEKYFTVVLIAWGPYIVMTKFCIDKQVSWSLKCYKSDLLSKINTIFFILKVVQ